MIHFVLLATQILVNGAPLNVSTIESNGVTYVPLEALSKALGFTVTLETNHPPATAAEPPQPQLAVTLTPPKPRAPTAIKCVLSWTHDIYKTHEPDIGAEAWLATSDGIAALAAAAGGTTAEPIPKRAGGWETKISEQFHISRAVADSHGLALLLGVAPGNYVLILHSRHAKDTTPRDRHGKMRFQPVMVRDGETTDASFNFGRTAYPEENARP